jgi:hypothetical protein
LRRDLLPLAGIVLAAACGGDRIALRYHPKAGTTLRYRLDQTSKIRFDGGLLAQAPAQEFTLHLFYSQQVTGPRQGGTGVRVTIDSAVMSSPTSATPLDPGFDRVRGLVADVTFDERMIPVTVNFQDPRGVAADLVAQMRGGVTAMAFPLPVESVRTGDTWTAETDLPLGQMMGATEPLKARHRLTVKDVQIASGDTTVLLQVETSFPAGPMTVTRQGVTATVQLSGTLSGEQRFSLSRGASLGGHVGGSLKVAMSMSGSAAPGMSLALDQNATLTLAEP